MSVLEEIADKILGSCEHAEIVESHRFANGSIYGRCTQCNEDGFPIRDVGYEQFLEARDRGEDIMEALAKWRIESIPQLDAMEPKKA